jgi:FkbM family methyltransferase
MSYVDVKGGGKIWFNPKDERGLALSKRSGNVNPGSTLLFSAVVDSNPWSLILDVGANYGELIVASRFDRNTRVIAYEPNPALLPYLEKTLGAVAGAEIRNTAVGGSYRPFAAFLVDKRWSGTSRLLTRFRELITFRSGMALILVKHTTIDRQFRNANLDSVFIKIDVEGGEWGVIEGAARMLHSVRRWSLMVEILHLSPEAVASLFDLGKIELLEPETGLMVEIASFGNLSSLLNKPSSALWTQDVLVSKTM